MLSRIKKLKKYRTIPVEIYGRENNPFIKNPTTKIKQNSNNVEIVLKKLISIILSVEYLLNKLIIKFKNIGR